MTDRTLAAMKAALPIISAGCTEAIRQGNAPFAVNAQTVERQLIAAIEAYEKQEPAGYIVQEETEDGFCYGYSASYPGLVHDHINETIQRCVDHEIPVPVMHCRPFFLHPAPTTAMRCGGNRKGDEMNAEELQLITNAIATLGAQGKDAFIYYLIFKYGISYLLHIVLWSAAMYATYRIVKLINVSEYEAALIEIRSIIHPYYSGNITEGEMREIVEAVRNMKGEMK